MFLKRVDITGFKSFANKTSLEFLDTCHLSSSGDDGKTKCGITAIVGPNGSGKSNVADAIRWAMGEQSMKNLRGKKAEDIIFAGSTKKARLSAASVTLYFDNSDKRIPIDFAEVSLTRKVYRDGEGEYLINGSRVRLIDIVDLLAKGGIGKDSYCVITQGMSDAVLSATPAERRMILEDAAGVKQYQIKKERALKKLDSTRENLDRVRGIITEIEPQLKMLKRQAEKALKGKDVAELLHAKQRLLFSYKWHAFQEEKAQALRNKETIGHAMMNLQREADQLNDEMLKESKVTEDFKAQENLEQERGDIYRKINEAEKELVITEGRIEVVKERQVQEKIIESIPVDSAFVRKHLELIHGEQEKLIHRLGQVETLEELQEIKEFARAIQTTLADLQQNVGKGKLVVEKANPEFLKFQEEKGAMLAKLSAKRDELRGRIAELKARIEAIGKEVEAEIRRNKESRMRIFELERNVRTKQDEVNRQRDVFNDAKIVLARIEVREEDLVGEVREELRTEAKDLVYDGATPCEPETLEKEIARLKFQFEQIGGIDPMVVDEYEEVNKRYEFLTKESADLEEAMKTLREVAKEMDRQIEEVFAGAFQKINAEFTQYFQIIFGGGKAELMKSKVKSQKSKVVAESESAEELGENVRAEESAIDDVDESVNEIGVDISACPPGKKIANLSMLSGGERALTSLALLFAIIAYNPPPFAILDEVEAALDEANSRRFGRILQELSGNTQFVAITHNRETMRQASLLYGVTMTEDGTSKILSVKMDQVGRGGEIKEQ